MILVIGSKHGKGENEHMRKSMMGTIILNFSFRYKNSSSEYIRKYEWALKLLELIKNGMLDIYVLEVLYPLVVTRSMVWP